MMILAIVEVMFLMFLIFSYIRSGKDNRRECECCPYRDICKEGKEDAE